MIEKIQGWIRTLVGYDELQIKYNVLYDRILYYDEVLEEYERMLIENNVKIKDIKDELEETREQLEVANQEIFYLTDYIDIDNFKDWYISRRGSQTWTYNWDNRGAKDVSKAFRYKDPKTGPTKLVTITNTIIDLYNINKPSKVEIIERVKQYFTRRGEWTYVFDKNNVLHPGVADYWQEIDISIDRRRGDCEDLAILMHMIIRTMFSLFGYEDDKWRLILTAGMMVGYGGHAYNLYLHDDGHHYVIESTFDLEGNFKRAWLKTPAIYNNLYRNFWGFTTPEKSWRNVTWVQNFEALKKTDR